MFRNYPWKKLSQGKTRLQYFLTPCSLLACSIVNVIEIRNVLSNKTLYTCNCNCSISRKSSEVKAQVHVFRCKLLLNRIVHLRSLLAVLLPRGKLDVWMSSVLYPIISTQSHSTDTWSVVYCHAIHERSFRTDTHLSSPTAKWTTM